MIVEERPTGTASPPPSSFVILFADRHSGLRHKSYMKHEIPDIGTSADSSTGSVSTTAAGPAVLETGSDPPGADPSCIPSTSGPTTRLRAKRERA